MDYNYAPYDYKKHWGLSNYGGGEGNHEWMVLLQKHLIPGSVLDVGCGGGRWVKAFEGRNYLGIDISPVVIGVARDQYPDKHFEVFDVVTDDLADTIYETDSRYSFDNIVTWTVLEHLPQSEIHQVVKKLKKWGKNIIAVEPVGFEEKLDSHCHPHDYVALGFKEVEDLQSVKMFQWKGDSHDDA